MASTVFLVFSCVIIAASACNVQDWFSVIRSGDYNGFQSCIGEHSVDVETRDEAGCTAIAIAVLNKHPELVKHLLFAGANINAQCRSGYTAFMYAAKYGNLDLIKQLQAGKADEYLTTQSGLVAAGIAAQYGHFEIVKYLLKLQDDRTLGQSWTGTSLMWGAAFGTPEMLEDLAKHEGGNVDAGDALGNTAAIWAGLFGNTKTLQELLRLGSNLATKNKYGFNALMAASYGGHSTTISYLLDKGLSVDSEDNLGYTPLMYAALGNKPDAADALLAHFAHNRQSAKAANWNPIMIAAASGHEQMVDFLLSKGTNPAHKNDHGDSAETLASAHGFAQIADKLSRIRSAIDMHDLYVKSSQHSDLQTLHQP